ncbi:unnamed protein product, partial [marine sediment metagenome]
MVGAGTELVVEVGSELVLNDGTLEAEDLILVDGSSSLEIIGNRGEINAGGYEQLDGAVLSFTADGRIRNRGITMISADDWVEVDGDLDLDLSASLLIGEIVLIDNNGTDPIGGTFDIDSEDIPDGWALTYTGGDGNDLVLYETSPPASQTLTWDGTIISSGEAQWGYGEGDDSHWDGGADDGDIATAYDTVIVGSGEVEVVVDQFAGELAIGGENAGTVIVADNGILTVLDTTTVYGNGTLTVEDGGQMDG